MTDGPTPQSLIAAVEAADSALALVQAVRALAAAQAPVAIPTLIKVLGFNNPGAAVAAVDGLVVLGREAVPILLEQLDGYNYGARAWAIRALAMIGDPQALKVLVETAEGDFALSVRRAATKGLGLITWEALPIEEQDSAQTSALAALQTALHDAEWIVRYAAVVGLAKIAETWVAQGKDSAVIDEQLWKCAHEDSEMAVRARAHWAVNGPEPSSYPDLTSANQASA